MKPKRKHIAILAVCLFVLAVLAVYSTRSQLPTHNGKSLDEWLVYLNQAGHWTNAGAAYDAVDAMGTNCVPYLFKAAVAIDPPWKIKAASLWSRQTLIHFLSPSPKNGADKIFDALRAYHIKIDGISVSSIKSANPSPSLSHPDLTASASPSIGVAVRHFNSKPLVNRRSRSNAAGASFALPITPSSKQTNTSNSSV